MFRISSLAERANLLAKRAISSEIVQKCSTEAEARMSLAPHQAIPLSILTGDGCDVCARTSATGASKANAAT
jgi:hypothetical protein